MICLLFELARRRFLCVRAATDEILKDQPVPVDVTNFLRTASDWCRSSASPRLFRYSKRFLPSKTTPEEQPALDRGLTTQAAP